MTKHPAYGLGICLLVLLPALVAGQGIRTGPAATGDWHSDAPGGTAAL